MLEVKCARPEPVFNREILPRNQTSTMPVDFTAYLLSASPPGFDMYNHFSGAPGFGGLGNRLSIPPPKSIVVSGRRVSSAPNLYTSEDDRKTYRPDFKGLDSTDKLSVDGDIGISLPNLTHEQGKSVTCLTSGSCSKLKKRVSFADDLGLALEVVKIIKESSDTPPQIRPEMLSSITLGACADVTQRPPLVLKFPQPASDYLAFREKLESNFVSLENVILKDYNVIGTIKVKNISFEKVVKVRCTFDSWETHTDIIGSYVADTPIAGASRSSSRYDTFKFEISVPPAMDMNKKIQFCICYEVNGTQYWDSCGGANYEVTSADWKENSTDSIFTINYERDWTTYSSWSSVDSTAPYY